ETLIENYEYATIGVAYKNFSQAPAITIQVNDAVLGTLQAGITGEYRILLSDKPVTLRIKRQSSNELLLDSVFVPKRNNYFTLFITDLLNVASFYTPPATPVPGDSNRLQLLNNVKVQGVGKKVNFKFFAPATPSQAAFEELTAYALNNVEYGKLSPVINIAVSKYPVGQPQTISRAVYIKAYDAETGQLLIDLKTGASNATYGRIISSASLATAGGKYTVVNVSVQNTSTVAYTQPFASYPM
ncbi:MAG: hypothetical protein ABW019_18285, partial [Chitinophagaceae bacterium]